MRKGSTGGKKKRKIGLSGSLRRDNTPVLKTLAKLSIFLANVRLECLVPIKKKVLRNLSKKKGGKEGRAGEIRTIANVAHRPAYIFQHGQPPGVHNWDQCIHNAHFQQAFV